MELSSFLRLLIELHPDDVFIWMTNPMLGSFWHFFRAALVWMLLAPAAFSMWDESRSEQIPNDIQSPKKNEPVSSSDQTVEDGKKQDVSVGFLLLIGLGIVAVTFAVMVVMWGSQVRRIARKRVSRQTLGDPLWYLKPKKTYPKPEKTDSEAQTPNPENRDVEST